MAFAAPAQLFAYPNAAIESMIQWYVPSLDVVEIFRCLMIVTDRNSELEALSTETAEVFGQLEDDCKWRVELCADGRARVVPLCVSWVLTAQISALLDLVASSHEVDVNAIFVIHLERVVLCAGGVEVCSEVQQV